MATFQTLVALVGLIFVLSVIVQAVQEVLKSALDTKCETMEKSLIAFMGAHLRLDQIKGALKQRGLDVTALEHFSKDDFRHLLDGIPFDQDQLKDLVQTGTATIEQVKDNIAGSYDAARAKFQAAYTRKNKLFAIGLAFLTVFVLDSNIISIYQELAADQVMAQAIAGKAQKATCGTAPSANQSDDFDQVYQNNRNCIKRTLQQYPILVRWYRVKEGGHDGPWRPMWWGTGHDWDDPFTAILGFLAMSTLVSLGAPFWNDVLKGMTGVNNALNSAPNKTS
jgi:hypothetical protein